MSIKTWLVASLIAAIFVIFIDPQPAQAVRATKCVGPYCVCKIPAGCRCKPKEARRCRVKFYDFRRGLCGGSPATKVLCLCLRFSRRLKHRCLREWRQRRHLSGTRYDNWVEPWLVRFRKKLKPKVQRMRRRLRRRARRVKPRRSRPPAYRYSYSQAYKRGYILLPHLKLKNPRMSRSAYQRLCKRKGGYLVKNHDDWVCYEDEKPPVRRPTPSTGRKPTYHKTRWLRKGATGREIGRFQRKCARQKWLAGIKNGRWYCSPPKSDDD